MNLFLLVWFLALYFAENFWVKTAHVIEFNARELLTHFSDENVVQSFGNQQISQNSAYSML